MATGTATGRIVRLDSLTGLRAIAAFAVFVHHCRGLWVHSTWSDRLTAVTSNGAMGVTFFFVLSGFVLTWSHRAADSNGSFYRRRFARVYPAYIVAFLLGAIISTGGDDGVHPVGFWTGVGLVQSWIPDKAVYFSVNDVSWSLSCEAFFYLLFPLLIPVLLRLRGRGIATALVGSVAAIAVFAVIGRLIGGELGNSWFALHLPPVRFADFAIGMLLAVALRRSSEEGTALAGVLARPWLLVLGCVASLGVYLGGEWIPGPYVLDLACVVPFALTIVAFAARDNQGHRGVMASRFMVWAGTISYCFYLVHQLVTRVLQQLLGRSDDLRAVGAFLLAAVAATVAAWLLHVVVERPLEKRLRGRAPERLDATPVH